MGNGLFHQGKITWHSIKRFLTKCFLYFQTHPSPNVLYVQVGDGNEDHQFWGRPEEWNGSDPRPALKATTEKPGYFSMLLCN